MRGKYEIEVLVGIGKFSICEVPRIRRRETGRGKLIRHGRHHDRINVAAMIVDTEHLRNVVENLLLLPAGANIKEATTWLDVSQSFAPTPMIKGHIPFSLRWVS